MSIYIISGISNLAMLQLTQNKDSLNEETSQNWRGKEDRLHFIAEMRLKWNHDLEYFTSGNAVLNGKSKYLSQGNESNTKRK